MALTADRNTAEMIGEMNEYPVLAATRIYTGALVVADASGWAKPGVTATGLKALGRAEKGVDNAGGANGAAKVRVKRGVFRFKNGSGADEIGQADIGNHAYIVDDETVARVSTGRSIAGKILGLDAQGVWVAVGFGVLNAPGGALLAANNLSDVTAATARANIGANKGALRIGVGSLVGTGVFRTVAPRAGTITKIYSVIDHALATGNATLTAKIGATAVTNGVVTVVQSGSAAGQVNSATPTANNTFVAGDVLSVTVGGTNDDADATAEVVIEFTY